MRNDFTFFRTSHWCFTPFVLEKSSFQTSFNNMIDWLFEPWGGPGSLAKGTALNQNSTGSPQELAARKFLWRSAQDRNRRFLEEAIPGGVRPVRNFLAYQKQYENWAIRHAQEQSEGVSAGPSE